MEKLRMMLVLLVLSAAGIVCQDTCTPDCTGKHERGVVTDPLNCTNYCLYFNDGTAADQSLPCDAGEHFDAQTSACASPADCTPTCKPPVYHITCNGSLSLISDAFDCSVYYICLANDVQGPLVCDPDRSYFNGEACVSDKEVCCTVSCTPYCPGGIVQVPDPTDCHRYYICTNAGPVNPDYHFQCDVGQVFDYQIGQCVTGVSCITLCDDGTAQSAR
nr:uncharacterized protein LOC128688641 [Cherax quadricarinatus]